MNKFCGLIKEMIEYLRAFVLGSSWLVFFPFFIKVAQIKDKNYSYETYTVLAPIYFGVMSMLALTLKQVFGFWGSYLFTGILSALIVFSLAYFTKAYPFTTSSEWGAYGVRLLLKHLVVFLSIIAPLDLLL